jgi:hypothetical protein
MTLLSDIKGGIKHDETHALFPLPVITSKKKTSDHYESIFLKRKRTKIQTGAVVLWGTRI